MPLSRPGVRRAGWGQRLALLSSLPLPSWWSCVGMKGLVCGTPGCRQSIRRASEEGPLPPGSLHASWPGARSPWPHGVSILQQQQLLHPVSH